MTDRKIITVLGATGAQGGGLVRAILADPSGGFAARAVTRNAQSDKARALAELGAEARPGVGRQDGGHRRRAPDRRGARSLEESRALNPELQTFDQWLAGHKDLIPLE